MGLVDKVRDQRDSWIKRFEEQRQVDTDSEFDNLSDEEQDEIIKQNREKVGKFSFDNNDK
ncbi:MAG: hypothetical protein E2O67_04650 [Deltaproteobacteria bacterium]|jgi:hypothetical protein|nr:hypothetical protein [Bacteroidota bacterium]MCH7927446.1 hypothetical protein [Candidatus Dadabacteria bacterium]TDI96237.1 MAG: hypothetical protein E2O29_03130 [Deltaproteobacteria bacterium]TDJ05844.1 MAG: hypothetical protein E2O67_04650 [Deltaproteobacteria bacterium]